MGYTITTVHNNKWPYANGITTENLKAGGEQLEWNLSTVVSNMGNGKNVRLLERGTDTANIQEGR